MNELGIKVCRPFVAADFDVNLVFIPTANSYARTEIGVDIQAQTWPRGKFALDFIRKGRGEQAHAEHQAQKVGSFHIE